MRQPILYISLSIVTHVWWIDFAQFVFSSFVQVQIDLYKFIAINIYAFRYFIYSVLHHFGHQLVFEEDFEDRWCSDFVVLILILSVICSGIWKAHMAMISYFLLLHPYTCSCRVLCKSWLGHMCRHWTHTHTPADALHLTKAMFS